MTLRRLFVRTLLVVLLLVVSLPLAILATLSSEAGTRWLLQQAGDLAQEQGIVLAFAASRGDLLGELAIEGLQVEVAGTRIGARELRLHWRPRALFGRRLHVRALELHGLQLDLPPPAEAADSGPPALPEIVLPLAVQLDRFLVDGLDVRPADAAAIDIERVAFAATLDSDGLVVRDLAFAGAGARVDGRLALGTRAPHALDGALRLHLEPALTGADVGAVQADLRLGGAALQPHLALNLVQPAELRVTGDLDLAQAEPAFDLEAHWAVLRWPLHGEVVQLRAADGRLRLHGTAAGYRVGLSTGLQVPDLPDATVELSADGDRGGARLQPLRVQALGGEVRVTGPVSWDPAPAWDLGVVAEKLDPGLVAPDWSGQLAGRIAVSGSLDPDGDAGLMVRAMIEELGGTLRGYPVAGSGRVEYGGGQVRLERLRLASGSNTVHLDGRVGDRLDLQYRLDAPQLGSLYPGLGGMLEGAGRVAGSVDAPQLKGHLKGGDIAFQTLQVGSLELVADWQQEGGQGTLSVSRVETGALSLDTASVKLKGTPRAHRLDLAIAGPQLDADLEAAGGWTDTAWQGTLQRLRLHEPTAGEWRLQEPAALSLAADQARTGRLCLGQQDTRVCLQGGWAAARGLDLEGRLSDLDLARLAPHIPGEAVVEGSLAGEVRVSGTTDAPRVEFRLQPSDGVVRLATDEEPLELQYRDADLRGRFEDDRGSAELTLRLGDGGDAAARVQIGAAGNDARSLRGEIRAGFPDLGLVAGFVPALQQVEGRLALNATLGGTVAAPRVRGELLVADASARLPAAGLELRDIDVRVRGDGVGPLQLEGQVLSGDGRLAVRGRIDPTAARGIMLDLAITGEDFLAVRLPEVQARVSPELQLSGAGDYRLTGLLRIPSAQIEIEELPKGSVAVSDDEIIVGEAPPPGRGGAPAKLSGQVRIELGDDVNFKGFGLTIDLQGAVTARFDPQGTSVDGEIGLVNGRYKAYGQDLTVEQGRLLFAGPPDRPELDLRAVRVSRDGTVKAYVAMSGPLSEPRPRIYSEPALPEAEALAYLVTGRGLNQASGQEGVDIASAAFSLGVAQGEPLIQDLSQSLGLDELRVESGETGLEDSSLVLGKYINPDLYVGYTQELFNPEGALLVRLRLTEWLEVESRSGRTQSVDLIYRFEHD